MAQPVYLFTRGQRPLYTEVYFPKKVSLQGRIFTSLEDGHNEGAIKTYLKKNASAILVELAAYPFILDPYWYGTVKRPAKPESAIMKAHKRIDMYVSQFQGWSMYEVDGMFFNRRGKIYEERTQVVRLMFRFKSRFASLASRLKCTDVLRSILYYSIRGRGMVSGEILWSNANRDRFMLEHEPWRDPAKKQFAERYFSPIACETIKWTDDCALFIFGYLVREFSQKVLETGRLEEEIWVVSVFDMTLNVIRKSQTSQTQTIEIERK